MDPEPSLEIISQVDYSLLFAFVGIFVLLFCSALVSGAEIALFSLTSKDIEDSIRQNSFKGKMINALLEQPKKLLATLLVANNFINITVITLFVFVEGELFHDFPYPVLKFCIGLLLITFLILAFGEVLPRGYASKNNLNFAQFIALPIYGLNKIVSPVFWLTRFVGLFLQKKLTKQKNNFSIDQLSQALELTATDATTTDEQKILEGIVSFGNTDAKQVMSPRIDVFALEISELFVEIYPKIVEKGFSRIPIYRDNIDQIEGVLFVKDILPFINEKELNWVSLLREPFFVPENKKLDDLLKDFQSMKSHLAIVVDEYGGTSGLVSLDDIIEEIVGEISDEYDDTSLNFSKIDDKNYIFEGKINLKDFYRIIDVDEDLFEERRGEAETLAGLILEILGNFPKKGQKIVVEHCTFVIESVDQKRIKQIKVTID